MLFHGLQIRPNEEGLAAVFNGYTYTKQLHMAIVAYERRLFFQNNILITGPAALWVRNDDNWNLGRAQVTKPKKKKWCRRTCCLRQNRKFVLPALLTSILFASYSGILARAVMNHELQSSGSWRSQRDEKETGHEGGGAACNGGLYRHYPHYHTRGSSPRCPCWMCCRPTSSVSIELSRMNQLVANPTQLKATITYQMACHVSE